MKRSEAVTYIEGVNARVGGSTFRLPTGAEWARAAQYAWQRAGRRALLQSENTSDSFFCPGGSPRVVSVRASTLSHEVPRHLFGNVAEWVSDTPFPGAGVVFGLDRSSGCQLLTYRATSYSVVIGEDWSNSFIGFRVAADLP